MEHVHHSNHKVLVAGSSQFNTYPPCLEQHQTGGAESKGSARFPRETRWCVLSLYSLPLQLHTMAVISPICCCFLTVLHPGTSNISYHALSFSMLPCNKRRNRTAAGTRHEGVMKVLKRENEVLRRALAQYNQAINPAALSSLTLPPHNSLPRQLPPILHRQNGQSAGDPHPMWSVNLSGPAGAL